MSIAQALTEVFAVKTRLAFRSGIRRFVALLVHVLWIGVPACGGGTMDGGAGNGGQAGNGVATGGATAGDTTGHVDAPDGGSGGAGGSVQVTEDASEADAPVAVDDARRESGPARDADSGDSPAPESEPGTCACVPRSALGTEHGLSLDCACASGLCARVQRGTVEDCLRFANGMVLTRETVRWYDDCGIIVIDSSSLDSPQYQWTLDAKTRSLVGLRYTPWAFNPLDPVDTKLYCATDASSGPVSTVTAGRTADGCTLSREEQICPPPDAGDGAVDGPD
jgi:hypothetical protein